MPERETIPVNFAKTGEEVTDRNFAMLKKLLAQMAAVAGGKLTGDISLAVGDNTITPPVPKPRGRLTVFQSAAADLFDVGLNASGQWVINASAATTCRFLFF